MEKKRPQLDAEELQQLRWLLGGCLALLALAGAWSLDVGAGWIAAAGAAGVAIAIARPDLPARVPAALHRLAFPLIVVWFACDLYLTVQALPALIRLNILLLAYRGATYRSKRDDLQVIALGLILVMIAGVLTVSLGFAGQMLLFTGLSLALLFVVTVAEIPGKARAGRGAPGAGGAPAWTRVNWRRFARRCRAAADPRLLALGVALFAGVVAMSALLFVSVPRFQIDSGFVLDRLFSMKTHTGFSDTIRLNDVVDIQQDDSVALRVDVSDPARLPAAPYWRMVVLDEYRGGEFRTSRALRNEMVLSTRMKSRVEGTAFPARETPATCTFYLEPGISRYLPLSGPFSLLRFQEPQWVQFQGRLHVLALRNEPATMVAYRVEGLRSNGEIPDRAFGGRLRDAQAMAAASARGGTPAYPLTTLELPPGEADREVLRRAAAAIAGADSPDARAFAARASRWLGRRHGYALQVTLPPGSGDPAVRWLDSDLPGHCELFTAAFTLLARAAGHPARAVTGFRGGDWNGFGSYFRVRKTQAHAWCEVYDGASGWFRVDPTAGASLSVSSDALGGPALEERRMDRSWSARFDALRMVWYRRIVNFDQRTQIALLTSIRESVRQLGEVLRGVVGGTGARLEHWAKGPWHAARVLGWCASLAVLIVGAWAWRRYGGAWWWDLRARRSRTGVDPVRRRAGTWLRRLARRGTGDPGVLDDLRRLRYGPRHSWPEPGAVFRRAARLKSIANSR